MCFTAGTTKKRYNLLQYPGDERKYEATSLGAGELKNSMDLNSFQLQRVVPTAEKNKQTYNLQ